VAGKEPAGDYGNEEDRRDESHGLSSVLYTKGHDAAVAQCCETEREAGMDLAELISGP
jgi:hypothetical protein